MTKSEKDNLIFPAKFYFDTNITQRAMAVNVMFILKVIIIIDLIKALKIISPK